MAVQVLQVEFLVVVVRDQPMVKALVSERFQQPVVVVVEVGIIAQD
jgi:hypothetical protein